MSRNVRVGSIVLVLVVAGVAGCLEDTSAVDYHAAGTQGRFALGWAYDGKSTLPFDGYITIHARERDNTGEAVGAGTLNGQGWRIVFDRFAEQPNKTFQDGGIVANLDEHGSTGVGDTSIPRVHVDLAAWGEAKVTVNGTALPDALTGEETWVAHFMVITTGVRDDGTFGIRTAGKNGTYDPAKADDGHAEAGDNEIHLVLKSHATAPPDPIPVTIEGSTGASPTMRNHPLENKYQNAELNATLSMTGNAVPQTRLTFTFYDPDGARIGNPQTIVQPVVGQPMPVPVKLTLKKTGAYRVEVSGNAVNAQYSVAGKIVPPANVVMNFWWEDVLFGAAAEAFEAEKANQTSDDHEHMRARAAR